MTRRRFLAATAALAALLVALDLGVKALAEAGLAGRPALELAGGLVVLVFTRNAGAFLSWGAAFGPAARTALLIVLPGAALLGFAAWLALAARPSRGLAALASLFLAGGLGNLVERVFAGSVRDYLNFGIGSLRTGVMNLADLYLVAALVALFVGSRKDGGYRDSPPGSPVDP